MLERDTNQQLMLLRLEDQAKIVRLQDELYVSKKEYSDFSEREKQKWALQQSQRELEQNNLNSSESQAESLRFNLTKLKRELFETDERRIAAEAEANLQRERYFTGLESQAALQRQLEQAKDSFKAAERLIVELRRDTASSKAAITLTASRTCATSPVLLHTPTDL